MTHGMQIKRENAVHRPSERYNPDTAAQLGYQINEQQRQQGVRCRSLFSQLQDHDRQSAGMTHFECGSR